MAISFRTLFQAWMPSGSPGLLYTGASATGVTIGRITLVNTGSALATFNFYINGTTALYQVCGAGGFQVQPSGMTIITEFDALGSSDALYGICSVASTVAVRGAGNITS